jgi:hypothetical protein
MKDLANVENLDLPRGSSPNEKARQLVLRYLGLNRQSPHALTPCISAASAT